jgi:phage shock protein B
MEEFFVLIGVLGVVIGLPWVVLHYITKWKQAPKITEEDERLLDDMHLLARRLEERVNTVERIIAADNPDFRLANRDPGYAREFDGSASRPSLDKPSYRLEGRN